MTPVPFAYALLRAVPRVERGEAVNVGVLVHCQARNYLCCGLHLDSERVRAVDPTVDLTGLRDALQTVCDVCAGVPEAGPAALLPQGARFRWLTAPRSTIVQPGPVHGGMTHDPAADLTRLVHRLVR